MTTLAIICLIMNSMGLLAAFVEDSLLGVIANAGFIVFAIVLLMGEM